MKHLFTIMIMVLALLWGFSVSSNAQVTCPSGNGCPGQNWCCPAGTLCSQQGVPADQARCAIGPNPNLVIWLANGACCLDGSFLPGTTCGCNQPPDCTNAAADPDYLWPPNHKFAEVAVIGVTDPDGDTVIITIDSIDQDEATETAVGAGNFCPDATGVGTSFAQVRAERSGTGDGRVYHIGFTADDGRGLTCSRTVTVCVPHDKSDAGCIDGGPLFDSTTCN